MPSRREMFRTLHVLLWALTAAPRQGLSELIHAGSASIALNCSETNGMVQQLAQINCGPLPVVGKDGNTLTQQYQDTGMSAVRTHDFFGPTDMSTIFPDFAADPDLVESYHFDTSDVQIKAIVDGNFQVLFRLGESATAPENIRHNPPSDSAKWAQIAKHIVMHYNDGWASGFAYNITYWEIWNEPDLGNFSPEQYYELYQTTAQVLKDYNPALKVGGPATSQVSDNKEPWARGFIEFVATNNVPLDFYSWHTYANSPADLYSDGRAFRDLLDEFGRTGTESINTEWNIWILEPQRDKDNLKNAAFTASSLIAMHDAGVDAAFRYRGSQDFSRLARLVGFDLSLFTLDGTYKTPALAYFAMNIVQKTSPIRLSTPEMNGSGPITWIGGKSADGTVVNLLISYFEDDRHGTDHRIDFDVTISDLPFPGEFTAARYLIDKKHHMEIESRSKVPASSDLSNEKEHCSTCPSHNENRRIAPAGPSSSQNQAFAAAPLSGFSSANHAIFAVLADFLNE